MSITISKSNGEISFFEKYLSREIINSQECVSAKYTLFNIHFFGLWNLFHNICYIKSLRGFCH